MRVFFTAVAFSAFFFAAGVVGDLSRPAPANAGPVVTLRLPPPLPADAVRAAPLPVLALGTASAAAAETPRRPRAARPAPVALEAVEEIAPAPAKPRAERMLYAPASKLEDGDRAKAKGHKGA